MIIFRFQVVFIANFHRVISNHRSRSSIGGLRLPARRISFLACFLPTLLSFAPPSVSDGCCDEGTALSTPSAGRPKQQTRLAFWPFGAFFFPLPTIRLLGDFPTNRKVPTRWLPEAICTLGPIGKNSRMRSGKLRLSQVDSARLASSVIMAFRALRTCRVELS